MHKYNNFVGAKNDVLKSRAFLAAIFIPIAVAFIVGLIIAFVPTFSILLSSLWGTMKLPLAIASLSIPLATWAIANHSSARATETLKIQDRKQLSELYFEQEKLFEKILTRKIENYKFEYITIKDLPVIHATIFDYKNLYKHGRVQFNNSICDKIKEVFEANNNVNLSFYESFINEKNGNNDSIRIQNLTASYIDKIQNNLMVLSPLTGCRVLQEGKTSLGMIISGYREIEHMLFEIKQYIFEDLTVQFITEDDYEVYNAIINITTAYYKCRPDELTIAKIISETETKINTKYITKSDIHHFIFRIMGALISKVNDACSHLHILQEDLEYMSLKIFSSDSDNSIKVFFTKTDEHHGRVGKLNVQSDYESQEIDVLVNEGKFTLGHNDMENSRFVKQLLAMSRALYFIDPNDEA